MSARPSRGVRRAAANERSAGGTAGTDRSVLDYRSDLLVLILLWLTYPALYLFVRSPGECRKLPRPLTRSLHQCHVAITPTAPTQGIVTIATRAHEADGTLVIEFKRTMPIPKRGHSIDDNLAATTPD